ncbi:MAG TPA: hypothetical protein VFD47_12110, partial [Actinomycetota bacterium]|nr:hypothetical protein [Actinomycetota bacterium]
CERTPTPAAAPGPPVAGALVPPLGWVCARIAEPFVTWVLAVGRTTGSWSWASIEAPEAWAWPLAALVIAAAIASLRADRDEIQLVSAPSRHGDSGSQHGDQLG